MSPGRGARYQKGLLSPERGPVLFGRPGWELPVIKEVLVNRGKPAVPPRGCGLTVWRRRVYADPAASPETTEERAAEVRRLVYGLRLRHHGQSLGGNTISLGVAAYPQHGEDPEAILGVADKACYQAKQAGRDQVAAAERRMAPGSAYGAMIESCRIYTENCDINYKIIRMCRAIFTSACSPACQAIGGGKFLEDWVTGPELSE
jgi:hypothetical protein